MSATLETIRPGFTFDEPTHRYAYKGVPVPSVTQVLDRYSGLEFVDAEVLRRAALFGTHVHKAVHLFNCDRLNWATLDPPLVPYVRAWETFLRESGAVVLHSENKMLSEAHGYAGTLDSLVFWTNSRRLIDVKSTASVPRTVGPQTAAYAELWKENHGDTIRDRYCVHLKPDGKYRAHKLDNPRDWQVFKAALTIHRWLDA
jgi:hypothetical protein